MFKDIWEVFTTFAWLSFGYTFLWDKSLILVDHFGYDSSYVMIQSVVFMVLYSLIGTIESIPFELYHIFVIEEKHGFNKQTPKLFITDTIKKIGISLVLIVIIVPIILYIIEWGGENFVFYVWIVVSIIIVELISIIVLHCFLFFSFLFFVQKKYKQRCKDKKIKVLCFCFCSVLFYFLFFILFCFCYCCIFVSFCML